MEIGVLDDGDERSWLRGEGKEMARGRLLALIR